MLDLSSADSSASFFFIIILEPSSSLVFLVIIGVVGQAFGDKGTNDAVPWLENFLTGLAFLDDYSRLFLGVDKG